MKNLTRSLLGSFLLAGLSVSISAQRNDDQKRPAPKDPPPKVEPREKPPKGDNRPKDDKPKKPGFAVILPKGTEGDAFA